MQGTKPIHQQVLQESKELKKKINTQEFCKLHGISESKYSRFPSDKFIDELMLFDYLRQYAEFSN